MTPRRGGSTMFQALASKKRRLISIATLAGLLGLAVSMVPRAPRPPARPWATSAARSRSGPSGRAPSSRTSRPCWRRSRPRPGSRSTTAARAATWTRRSTPPWPVARLPQVALVPDPGTVLALAKKGAIQPLAPVLGSEVVRLRVGVEQARHLQRQALRGLVQGRQQEHDLVQPGRVRRGGHQDARQRHGSSC